MMSDSLFARATSVPRARAASVVPRPAAPVIALRTMSASRPATASAAVSPRWMTSTGSLTPRAAASAASRRRISASPPAGGEVSPMTGTQKSRACSSSRSSWDPAASPMIACSWRCPDRTSRAWVPTDPVEPTTMNLRLLTPTDDAKVLWEMTRQPSGERGRPPMVRRAGAPVVRHAASLLGTVVSKDNQWRKRWI